MENLARHAASLHLLERGAGQARASDVEVRPALAHAALIEAADRTLHDWQRGIRCVDCIHHRRAGYPSLVYCARGVLSCTPLRRLHLDGHHHSCAAFSHAPDAPHASHASDVLVK